MSIPATTPGPSNGATPSQARFVVFWGTPSDIEAFERHYHATHIPLARQLPGLRRYTLSRNVSTIRGGEPYYLIAELDWDDMDSLRAAFQSEVGQRTGADVAYLAGFASVQSMTYELADV